MSALEVLLPRQANNDDRSGTIPRVAFYFLVAMTTFRSSVHFFKSDSGVNSIASLMVFDGVPDPNLVIYGFSSLWGSQQMIMVILYGIVLLRYRNLIPLMWALMAIEVAFRITVGLIHPLTPEYYAETPPGRLMNLPLLLVSLVMVFLSVRNAQAVRDPIQAGAARAT